VLRWDQPINWLNGTADLLFHAPAHTATRCMKTTRLKLIQSWPSVTRLKCAKYFWLTVRINRTITR